MTNLEKRWLNEKKLEESNKHYRENKYDTMPVRMYNEMYWTDRLKDDDLTIIVNKHCGTTGIFTKQIPVDEVERKIKHYVETGNDDWFTKDIIWHSNSDERLIFDTLTRMVVGNLVDRVKPNERFFVISGIPDTHGRYCGDPKYGTIDMLRGTGKFIDYIHNGKRYFNQNYFKNICLVKDVDERYKIIDYNFNFSVISPNKRFRILQCDFKKDFDFDVKSESDLMSFEEHFVRLYGKLPEVFVKAKVGGN